MSAAEDTAIAKLCSNMCAAVSAANNTMGKEDPLASTCNNNITTTTPGKKTSRMRDDPNSASYKEANGKPPAKKAKLGANAFASIAVVDADQAEEPPSKNAKFNSARNPAESIPRISQLSRAGLEEALQALLANEDTAATARKVLQNCHQQDVEADPAVELESGAQTDQEDGTIDSAQAWKAYQDFTEAKKQWKKYKKLDPTKFIQKKDIWMKILGFVGPGQFVYVAGVNHQMKEHYIASFGTDTTKCIHVLPTVNRPKRPSTSTDTFYRAAFASVACADYWKENTKEDYDRPTDGKVCSSVARYGNVEVLKWTQRQGFEWDFATCSAAAGNGHVDCLKYAGDHGCDLCEFTCMHAAKNGQLECLKYALDNGCPWDWRTCASAAANGHLDCLKYAHEKGCEWNSETSNWAAEKGQLECLKYAHDNGCPWDWRTCESAAKNGHLEILKYLHDNGCEWDAGTCRGAAADGHLECLKYAHDNSCSWDESTCANAAHGGHFEVLKYAHGNGCPWDWRTYYLAKYAGHHDIAEWAKTNGCPVDDEESEDGSGVDDEESEDGSGSED